jgi:NADH:ubiquinone oxidoreductase subunit
MLRERHAGALLPEERGRCHKPVGTGLEPAGISTDGAMTLGTRLLTWLRGEYVGTDSLGNRYYRDKGQRQLTRGGGRASREKRWVIYKGEPEGSKVPAEWHAWLHHTIDEPPNRQPRQRYPWEKEHLPNLTGTPLAYRPPGSILRGGRREPAYGEYEPWTPE